MKRKLIITTIVFSFALIANAQKPFKEIGKDNEVADVLTLSNGRYVEYFTYDTLRQIGSVMFNTVTHKVEYFIPQDDVASIEVATRTKEASRFMSVDPLAYAFPELSPYQYSSNNPIQNIDMDGLEGLAGNLCSPGTYHIPGDANDDGKLSDAEIKSGAFIMGKLANVAAIGVTMVAQPEIGIPWAVGALSGVPVTPAPQAWSQVGTAAIETSNAAKIEEAVPETMPNSNAAGLINERKSLAESFYKKFGEKNIPSKLAGIDFNKDVSTPTLKAGTMVEQWVGEDGTVGKYFAPAGSDPSRLGIDPTAKGTLKQFKLIEDVKVLQTTAADFEGNKGGGMQYFSPELKNKAVPAENKH